MFLFSTLRDMYSRITAHAAEPKVWTLLLLCTVFSATFHAVKGLAWVLPNPRGVFLPEQFGVVHSQLAGTLQLNDATTTPAAALVYLKLLQTNTGVLIRGHAWFRNPVDLTQDLFYDSAKMFLISVADFMPNVTSHPTFEIRNFDNIDSSNTFQLHFITPETVSTHHAVVDAEHLVYSFHDGAYTSRLPYTLEGSIPGLDVFSSKAPTCVYKFCINTWPECVPIPVRKILMDSNVILQQSKHMPHPTILSVHKPLFNLPVHVAAELLYYHTVFHMHLGMNATIVYDRGDQDLMGFLRLLDLETLVTRNQLLFMAWTHNQAGSGVPTDYSNVWRFWDQPLVYSHAALAFWGLNTYLYYADPDEFLSLPEGQTLRGQLSQGGCLHDKVYMQYERINLYCEHGNLLSKEGHALKYFPLASRNQTLGWFTMPKVLVLADAVACFYVHDGFVFPDMKDRSLVVDLSCGTMVHLQNFVVGGEGRGIPKEFSNQTRGENAWMWPLKEVSDEQQKLYKAGQKLLEVRPLQEYPM